MYARHCLVVAVSTVRALRTHRSSLHTWTCVLLTCVWPQVIPVVGGRPFILFGVALAPPTANCTPGTPATAAVVASRDRSLGRYSSRVLLQPWWHPQQQQQQAHLQTDIGNSIGQPPSPYIVQGLKGAAKELLIDFFRQNGGRKPEALLCYRAVSSDGQGQELAAAEYEALRA